MYIFNSKLSSLSRAVLMTQRDQYIVVIIGVMLLTILLDIITIKLNSYISNSGVENSYQLLKLNKLISNLSYKLHFRRNFFKNFCKAVKYHITYCINFMPLTKDDHLYKHIYKIYKPIPYILERSGRFYELIYVIDETFSLVEFLAVFVLICNKLSKVNTVYALTDNVKACQVLLLFASIVAIFTLINICYMIYHLYDILMKIARKSPDFNPGMDMTDL